MDTEHEERTPADAVPEPAPEPEAGVVSDPHAQLLARLRARNAASEVNFRIKSGELP